MTTQEILALGMDENDSGATTIKGYLKALLLTLWQEEEGFSGKRPFGNSSWKFELYTALVKHKVVRGDFDEDGYLDDVDTEAADNIINQCILDL